MHNDYSGPENLIFVGAGATAALGFPCTSQQETTLHGAAELPHNADCKRSYYIQVANILLCSSNKLQWLVEALADLLELVDYEDELKGYENLPCERHFKLLEKNAPAGWTEKDSRKTFFHLRENYSWNVLRTAVLGCPYSVEFSSECSFHLNDLYNLFDFHLRTGHGIQLEKQAVSPKETEKARNLLLLIQYIQMYGAWHNAIKNQRGMLSQYYNFAKTLGTEMLAEGFRLVNEDSTLELNARKFYLMSYGIVSMNYDPIFLMMIMCAHNDLNKQPPYIGAPPQTLKLFNDFSYFMATPRLHQQNTPAIAQRSTWFPLNEPVAQRLNDPEHISRRVRIGKFLMTHGMIGMRDCPNCGKVTNYLGEEWSFNSPDMMLPPPLNAFKSPDSQKQSVKENNEFLRLDQLHCVHCGALLGIDNLLMAPQSSFKSNLSPVLEEIGRDMRVLLMACKHVILLGYSLPKDDAEFRAILSARLSSFHEKKRDKEAPRCSVIVGTTGEKRWIYGAELKTALQNSQISDGSARETILQAISIFGLKQVRYYGAGIPAVFYDDTGTASPEAIKKMLKWDG